MLIFLKRIITYVKPIAFWDYIQAINQNIRGMKNIAVVIALVLFALNTYGQSRFDKVEIKATEVADNIFMLEGSGGNIAVIKGVDGVLMIDSQFAPLSDKIKKAIASISESDIKYLLNTHWHGDHTGGNNNFGSEGTIIVAHENVLQRMSTDQVNVNRTTKASPKAAWPVITFTEDMKVHFNGEDIAMVHIHNAHTDGDALVYFTNANVLHMGDTFFNGRFPYIDLGSGGSVQGLIDAISKAMMIVDDETKIIPGHGSLGTKADLIKYHRVVVAVFEGVKEAIASGKSLEEIKASDITKPYDGWGSGFISDERFLDIIWTDLNRE